MGESATTMMLYTFLYLFIYLFLSFDKESLDKASIMRHVSVIIIFIEQNNSYVDGLNLGYLI